MFIIIIPCMRAIYGNKKYSLNLLLKSRSAFDIVICAVLNPSRFWEDFAQIIIYQIYLETLDFLEEDVHSELMSHINLDTFQSLESVVDLNSKERFYEFTELLRETYLSTLVYLDIRDCKINYNFKYLSKCLQDFSLTFNKIKLINWTTKNYTNDLANFHDIKIFRSEFFSQTQFSILTQYIIQYTRYTKYIDTMLEKWYNSLCDTKYKQLKIDAKDQEVNIDSTYIWRQIERRILHKDHTETFNSDDNIVEQSIYHTPRDNRNLRLKTYTECRDDCLIESGSYTIKDSSLYHNYTINNETYINNPYFNSSMRNSKKVGLIFESEYDIVTFLYQLKKIFGDSFERDIYIPECCIHIRICEIKNKFNKRYIDNIKEYKDLKVIFEVLQDKLDLSFYMEIQCNILIQLLWHKSSNIIDTYTTNATQHVEEKDEIESTPYHYAMSTMQFIVIFAMGVFMLLFVGYAGIRIYNDIYPIWCYNGYDSYCNNYCYGLDKFDNKCVNWWNYSNKSLGDVEIKNYCSKFKNSDLNFICYERMNYKENLGFVEGLSDDNICYYDKPFKLSCLNNSKSVPTNLINSIDPQMQTIHEISHSFISINNNSLNLTHLKDTYSYDEEKIRNFNLIGVSNASINNNRFCTLSNASSLYCSGSSFHYDNIIAGGMHTCLILPNDSTLHCFGLNDRGQTDVPNFAKNGNEMNDFIPASTIQASAGFKHTCAIFASPPEPVLLTQSNPSKPNYHFQVNLKETQKLGLLSCWGDNISGQTLTPSSLKNVSMVSTGHFHSCAIDENGRLECWGCKGASYDISVCRVPERFHINTISVTAGYLNTCAIDKDNRLYCWGNSDTGVANVPREISNNVYKVGLGNEHACALYWKAKTKPKRKKKGKDDNDEDEDKMESTDNESTHTAGKDLSDQTLSVFRVQCWGRNKEKQLSIPENVRQSTILSLGVGANHNCVRMESGQLACWGKGDMDGIPSIPSILSLGVGMNHSCATQVNGRILCWSNGNSVDRGKYLEVPEGLQRKAEVSIEGVDSFSLGYEDDLCYNKTNDGGKFDISCQVGSGIIDDLFKKYQNDKYLKMQNKEDNMEVGEYCLIKDYVCYTSIKDVRMDGSNSINSNGIKLESFNCMNLKSGSLLGDDSKSTIVSEKSQIHCGYEHACILRGDKSAYCIGSEDRYNESVLGDEMGKNIYKLKAGKYLTCIINVDFVIICNGRGINEEFYKYENNIMFK